MFSLLGEGERTCRWPVVTGVKNGDDAAIELRVGESKGVGLGGFGVESCRIHGADDRFSETVELTGEGDRASGIEGGVTSSLPSA